MAKQAKGNKTGKTWLSTISGVNIKAPAVEAAEVMGNNEETIKLIRATAAEAMLNVGRATARTGQIEAVDHAAYWYGQARMEYGISESTVTKEKSQLRAICRACFGGVKVIKKLEENETLYTHEFAALARKITPKAFAKVSNQKAGNRVKDKVTDKEFAKMRQWAHLLSPKQRAVIVAILQKVEKAKAEKAAKVVPLKKAA